MLLMREPFKVITASWMLRNFDGESKVCHISILRAFISDGTRRNGIPAPFLTQNLWL
jgi:hypothetical protein